MHSPTSHIPTPLRRTHALRPQSMWSVTLKSLLLGALVAPVALTQVALAQDSKDKVFELGSDKAKLGKITEESLVEIVMQIEGGGKQTIAEARVARVLYGEGDAPFRKAQEAIETGNAAAALKELEPLQPGREIFVPRRFYWLGRAYELAGQPDKAIESYNQILSKHAKSRYARDCVRSLVDLQIRLQKFADAIGTADKGVRIADEIKRKELVLDFRFIKASAFEAQGKAAEAEAEFKAVAGEAATAGPNAARVGSMANIGQARLAAKSGDAARAKTILDPILKGTDASLLGAAYGAMGEALYAQGVKETNAEKLREAIFDNFLRALVQYPPNATDSTDPLEQAMLGCAKAYKKLSEVDKPKEQADSWKKLGVEICKEFRGRFPQSRLLKQVEDLQKEFK